MTCPCCGAPCTTKNSAERETHYLDGSTSKMAFYYRECSNPQCGAKFTEIGHVLPGSVQKSCVKDASTS